MTAVAVKGNAAEQFAALLTSGKVGDIRTLASKIDYPGTIAGVEAGLDVIQSRYAASERDRQVGTAVACYLLRDTSGFTFQSVADRMGLELSNVKQLALAGEVVAKLGISGGYSWGQLRTASGKSMTELRKAVRETGKVAEVRKAVAGVVLKSAETRAAAEAARKAEAEANRAAALAVQAETQRQTPNEVTPGMPSASGARTPAAEVTTGPSNKERARIVRDAIKSATPELLRTLPAASLVALATDVNGLAARIRQAQTEQASAAEALKNGKAPKK